MLWICKQRGEREGHSTNPDKRNEGPKQVVMAKQPQQEMLRRKNLQGLTGNFLWR